LLIIRGDPAPAKLVIGEARFGNQAIQIPLKR
jgi:hypothetical protein